MRTTGVASSVTEVSEQTATAAPAACKIDGNWMTPLEPLYYRL